MVLPIFVVIFHNISMISYDPLWETLKKKKVSKYALVTKHGLSNGTIDRLRANEHISTHTIEKLCKALNCTPNDIFKITDNQ